MRATFLALTLAAAATLTITTDGTPRCFEDEVIVWTGEGHDRCVPVDAAETHDAPAFEDRGVGGGD